MAPKICHLHSHCGNHQCPKPLAKEQVFVLITGDSDRNEVSGESRLGMRNIQLVICGKLTSIHICNTCVRAMLLFQPQTGRETRDEHQHLPPKFPIETPDSHTFPASGEIESMALNF